VIRIEQEDRVRRIHLAAPERHNVFDGPMSVALLDQLKAAESDAATRVILLGADGPMFCGGSTGPIDPGIFQIGSGFTKPMVVAVKGVALGAGLALIASAHVAMAAQGSSFGFVDIREGRWNQDLFASLSRSIGARRALELGLTGRIFTAPDALSWGLVHQLAPAFEIDERAESVARSLAAADTAAIQAAVETRLKNLENTRSSPSDPQPA
jgi:enoyl-CoA hydratase/carnithine racemase